MVQCFNLYHLTGKWRWFLFPTSSPPAFTAADCFSSLIYVILKSLLVYGGQFCGMRTSSAFIHKTRPINLYVELLPDPWIGSWSDLFLASPNDCWLFFAGVADGMVTPHEKVSPCIYPEYYLPFITISLIVLLFSMQQSMHMSLKVRFPNFFDML